MYKAPDTHLGPTVGCLVNFLFVFFCHAQRAGPEETLLVNPYQFDRFSSWRKYTRLYTRLFKNQFGNNISMVNLFEEASTVCRPFKKDLWGQKMDPKRTHLLKKPDLKRTHQSVKRDPNQFLCLILWHKDTIFLTHEENKNA